MSTPLPAPGAEFATFRRSADDARLAFQPGDRRVPVEHLDPRHQIGRGAGRVEGGGDVHRRQPLSAV